MAEDRSIEYVHAVAGPEMTVCGLDYGTDPDVFISVDTDDDDASCVTCPACLGVISGHIS